MNTVTLNVREMRKYSRESFQSVKENWQSLLLLILFVCGLFCGSMMQKNNSYNAQTFAGQLVSSLTGTQWITRLTPLLAEVMIGLLLAFFSGFNAIGLPILLCLPCLKGMAYGVLAAQLYTVYRVKGVVFSLLVLFPFLAAEITLLIVCLSASMQMSASLFSILRGGGGAGERGAVKTYGVHYFIASVVSVLIVLLQSFLGGAIGDALLN